MAALPNRIAFVDVETTGGRILSDRIIEIGIVRVEDNQVVETFSSLVDPQCAIPQMITKITGITGDMVERAPSFRQICEQVESLLEGCTMVAHNVRFDYSFLKSEFSRENMKFSPKHFCTVKLAKKLFPNLAHHDLSTLIEVFQIPCQNRHRALDDAKVLWDFYQLIQKSFDADHIAALIAIITKKPTLPINITADAVATLPQSPGVYIFYGDDDMPLYVGKSVNIKMRVLSHFSADYISSTEMKIAQQARRIETISTCGELGALLKESQLVKTITPLFNRKLRRCQKFVSLEQTTNRDGYTTVSFQTHDTVSFKTVPSIYGLYKSKSQAKNHLISLAEQYNLCQKLLGIEKTNAACFAYQLGRCKGACVGQENPAVYNTRMLTAFVQTRIRPWLYNGPILLMEHDKVEPRYDAFLVDQWCLIDQFSVNEDVDEADDELVSHIEQLTGDNLRYDAVYFDVDVYKIIDSFLRQPKNRRFVYELRNTKARADIRQRFLGVI